MLFESPQLLFLLFLVGIALVAYEMRASLRPAYCPACPHCRAAREEARRREAELADSYPGPEPRRHHDDEDRRP